jgi:hypothetical protein
MTMFALGNGNAFILRNLLADLRLDDITTCNTLHKPRAALEPKIEAAIQLRANEIRV